MPESPPAPPTARDLDDAWIGFEAAVRRLIAQTDAQSSPLYALAARIARLERERQSVPMHRARAGR